MTNILFFNHNVKFRINYKFVIFFCLQVLLFSKFLYQFAKIAKNWMPSESKKIFFEI